MVADPKALHYILHTSTYNFPKRWDLMKVTEMITGEAALVCAQGTELFFFHYVMFPVLQWGLMDFVWFHPGKAHELQKKIMAPTFFASRLNAFVPMFQDAASKVVTTFTPSTSSLRWVKLTLISIFAARSKVER
jgi:cytochrome P450